MRRKFITFIYFYFVLGTGFAIGQDTRIEITKIDITKIPYVKSTDISVLGIKLGDSKNKVLELIGKPLREWECQIFYKGIEVFIGDDKKVGAIALDSDFKDKLIGDTKILVTTDISVNEELRYKLLGKEDKLEQIDESETILGRIIKIRYYYNKGMELHWTLQFVNNEAKTYQKFFLVYPYYKNVPQKK